MIELKPKEMILVSSKEELPESFDYRGASVYVMGVGASSAAKGLEEVKCQIISSNYPVRILHTGTCGSFKYSPGTVINCGAFPVRGKEVPRYPYREWDWISQVPEFITKVNREEWLPRVINFDMESEVVSDFIDELCVTHSHLLIDYVLCKVVTDNGEGSISDWAVAAREQSSKVGDIITSWLDWVSPQNWLQGVGLDDDGLNLIPNKLWSSPEFRSEFVHFRLQKALPKFIIGVDAAAYSLLSVLVALGDYAYSDVAYIGTCPESVWERSSVTLFASDIYHLECSEFVREVVDRLRSSRIKVTLFTLLGGSTVNSSEIVSMINVENFQS